MSRPLTHNRISASLASPAAAYAARRSRAPLASDPWPLAPVLTPRPSALAPRRIAFTMAEVLFAIIILGLGLILLAAAFPVGIAQTEKTQDFTTAGIVARLAFDQMTKVPASGTVPTPGPGAPPLGPDWYAAGLGPTIANYAPAGETGRPMPMGLLDGTQTPVPDLRAKLACPSTTYTDGYPQDQTNLGQNAPVSYCSIWGLRSDVADPAAPPPFNTVLVWHENVQWAYPGDRRYYWYAFYRQMYEGNYPHPIQRAAEWTPVLTASVASDHITRRTYRVSVVVCRLPQGQNPVSPPFGFQQRYRSAQIPANLPGAYEQQWQSLAPIRLPNADGNPHNLAPYVGGGVWIADANPAGQIHSMMSKGQIRRGGTMLDCWGNIYQITDMTNDALRLDRPLFAAGATTPGGTPMTIDDVLPLWFNPNAIAVFPAIMTKQADLP
jgi:type II secretory pathway pseudopilin PulG